MSIIKPQIETSEASQDFVITTLDAMKEIVQEVNKEMTSLSEKRSALHRIGSCNSEKALINSQIKVLRKTKTSLAAIAGELAAASLEHDLC